MPDEMLPGFVRFDLEAQIRCVEREIRQRERAYPRFVADKKMTQAFADYQIDCMKACLDTLKTKRGVVP